MFGSAKNRQNRVKNTGRFPNRRERARRTPFLSNPGKRRKRESDEAMRRKDQRPGLWRSGANPAAAAEG